MSMVIDRVKVKVPATCPPALRDGGCPFCDHGASVYPEIGRALPLFLRDGVLHGMGVVSWCDCAFGKARGGMAERTWQKVLEGQRTEGLDGEYLAPSVLRAVRAEYDAIHDEYQYT